MKKFKSLLLAAIMCITPYLSSNALEEINIKGKEYVLPKYNTILHPNKKEYLTSDETLVPFSQIPYFVSTINGKPVVMPVATFDKQYISPNDPNYQNSDQLLKENYDFLKKNFSYDERFKEADSRNSYTVVNEAQSLDLMGVFLGNTFIQSKTFFKDDYYVVDPLLYYANSFQDLMRGWNKNYDKLIEPYIGKDAITFLEFKDYYTNIISEKNWPVTPALIINKNESIPSFDKNELSKDASDVGLYYIWYTDENNKESSKAFLITSKESQNEFEIFDYYSGVSIYNFITDVYNKQFLREVGLNGENFKSLFPIFFVSDNLDSESKKNRIYNCSQVFGPEYTPYFSEVRTISDAIEVYQLLPKEMQVDYSKYNFGNNPRIVANNQVK